MRRATLLSLFFLITHAAIFCGQAHAQRIGLSNLVIDNQEGRIKIRFGVDIKAVDAVKEALSKGQVLALECKASLALKRDYTWNTDVAQKEVLSRLVLYDRGPYEIILPDGRQEHYRGQNLEVLMKEAWGSMILDLGAWSKLTRGDAYSLTLEIRLVRQNVSSWLKGALFFWNFDAIAPVKYQLDFSY